MENMDADTKKRIVDEYFNLIKKKKNVDDRIRKLNGEKKQIDNSLKELFKHYNTLLEEEQAQDVVNNLKTGVVHKRERKEDGDFYLCNQAVGTHETKMTDDWVRVTCKNCLKHSKAPLSCRMSRLTGKRGGYHW